ncbi:hypothetical protein MNBD_ALPHA06-39, partial [hydrothermal vent metagenome]
MALAKWKPLVMASVSSAGVGVAGHIQGWGIWAQSLASSNDLIASFLPLIPAQLKTTAFETWPGLTIFLLIFLPLYGFFILKPTNNTLAFCWPDLPGFLDPRLEKKGASDIDAFAPDQSFLGRAADITSLSNFGDIADKHGWMALHGPMGHGKTRLGLEWLKSIKRAGWDTGVLRPRTSLEAIAKSKIRKSTAIMIDDANSHADLWEMLSALIKRAGNKRLRVLLVDQSIPVLIADIGTAKSDTIKNTGRSVLFLKPLPDEAAQALGAENNLGPQEIKNAEGRPLLLRLGADPWGEIARRGERRLKMADDLIGQEGKKLLAFSALAGAFGADEIPKDVSDVTVSVLTQLYEGHDRKSLTTNIPALLPNILAGEVLLQWLTDQTDAASKKFIKQAIAINPEFANTRIAGMLRERHKYNVRTQNGEPVVEEETPTGQVLQLLADSRPVAWNAIAIQQIDNLRAEQNQFGKAGKIDPMLGVYAQAKYIAAGWPFSADVQNGLAGLSVNCLFWLLADTHDGIIIDVLDDLQRLHANWPDDQQIALRRAMGAVNAVNSYGEATDLADKWKKLHGQLQILQNLNENWHDDQQIALHRAM